MLAGKLASRRRRTHIFDVGHVDSRRRQSRARLGRRIGECRALLRHHLICAGCRRRAFALLRLFGAAATLGSAPIFLSGALCFRASALLGALPHLVAAALIVVAFSLFIGKLSG